jgi:hypothetical protein
MGERLPQHAPCAKGAICHCLDEFSKGDGAHARVSRLRDALAALAPPFDGLTEVFNEYLLSHVIKNAAARAKVVADLEQHWFDQNSRHTFFPGEPVASIYAPGVVKALDLALEGRPLVPLNAWWLIGFRKVKLLSLADVDEGVTIGGRVTLLILTPRPRGRGRPTGRPILGNIAQALVTEYHEDRVRTIDVRRGP